MSQIEESKEFSGPSELSRMDRRDFMKYLGLFSSMSVLASCSRPAEHIVPYLKEVEDFSVGNFQYYSTVHNAGGFAQGILARSFQGRPVKVEGNPDHLYSHGATTSQAQAMIYDLYHPDRNKELIWNKKKMKLRQLKEELLKSVQSWEEKAGEGVAFIIPPDHSPTLKRIIKEVQKKFPQTLWASLAPWQEERIFTYHLAEAEIVVSFDEDLFFRRPDALKLADDFMQRRLKGIGDNNEGKLNKLIVFESSPSLTGAKADVIQRLRSEEVWNEALDLLKALQGKKVENDKMKKLARELRAKKAVVAVSSSLHPDAYELQLAFNQILANDLSSLREFSLPVNTTGEAIKKLIRENKLQTLIMIEADLFHWDEEWEELFSKVQQKVSLASYPQATYLASDSQIASGHSLEHWGDLEDIDQQVLIQQPLIEPLFDSLSPLAFLSLIANGHDEVMAEVQKTHALAEKDWMAFLKKGVLKKSVKDSSLPELRKDFKPLEHSSWSLKIIPDPSIDYGQYANNPMLQELPKPFSKLTWRNALYISSQDAEKLKLQNGDVLKVKTQKSDFSLPVWHSSLLAPGMLVSTLGYGMKKATRIAQKRGVNLYPFAGEKVLTVEKKRQHVKLAFTQNEKSAEVERFIKSATLPLKKEKPPTKPASFYPEHPLPPQEKGPQWAMTIDLTTCIGCEACVSACQTENNIPFVGEEQVKKDRILHWIRIDTYIQGPGVSFQPVPCMHCEKAPCEVVCPVNATVHGNGGLNEMIYNRCVGTRYCSNNCPYKVRRFNFRAYSALKSPWHLGLNPEVSVRDRGVMEKCTYCIQRIKFGERNNSEVKTACQQVCPTRAIEFDNLKDASSSLVKNKSSARNFDLLEEEGTLPRTSYLKVIRMNHDPA